MLYTIILFVIQKQLTRQQDVKHQPAAAIHIVLIEDALVAQQEAKSHQKEDGQAGIQAEQKIG